MVRPLVFVSLLAACAPTGVPLGTENGTPSALRSSTAGFFAKPITTHLGSPWDLKTADFDHDGHLDLVVTSCQLDLRTDLFPTSCAHDNVTVLLGQGDGATAPMQTLSAGHLAQKVVVGDIDGDGWTDAVVGSEDSTMIFRNQGGVLVPAPTRLPRAFWLAVADLDGNGALDVVGTDQPRSLFVASNLGGGQLAAPVSYPTVAFPWETTLVDVDEDGHLDAVITSLDGTAYVYSGGGDGTFGSGTPLAALGSSESIVVADLDGDGMADVAIAEDDTENQSINVFMNNRATGLGALPPRVLSGPPTAMVAADFDGDGLDDVAYTYWFREGGASHCRLAFALSGSGETTPLFGPDLLAPDIFDLTAGDFNGDGRPDIAYTDNDHSLVGVMLNIWPARRSVVIP